MTIDSLACNFNFVTCNPGCEEPVNFAYLQVGGVPAGPPSPQLADVTTELGNAQTLKMNPNDVLQTSITDPAAGFTATVRDLTTGQTGFITASADNGFMDTDPATCNGFPFTFHAEYATAGQQNQVPWAALEGGVLMQQETGHFEVCSAVSHKLGFSFQAPDGQSLQRPERLPDLRGAGRKGSTSVGRGSVQPEDRPTARTRTTEGTTGPQPCPTRSAASAQLCEFSDAPCFPQGTRTLTVNGSPAEGHMAGGGLPRRRLPERGPRLRRRRRTRPNAWPNGSAEPPDVVPVHRPVRRAGNPIPRSSSRPTPRDRSSSATRSTGANCDAPPLGAKFYPFWTMNNSQTLNGITDPVGACVWNFGNVIHGVTTQNLRQGRAVRAPDVSRYGGTTTAPVMPNPEFSGSCPTFTSG